jgi:hypothetical protein
LGPDVYAIELSQDGELVSVSTNPEDDQGTCVYYPPLEAIQRPSHVKIIQRSDLLELDRLGPNVDLVSYTSPTNGKETTKVVFKYYFLFQFIYKIWHERNLWMRLPPHPNIVPFGRLVVDELFGQVVGFTSLYIPGGTLSENPSRIFKLKWLRQLMGVIDDLNLKYGIAHQDIAPRNMLINPKTDAIMLFDFNYSGRIGGVGHRPDRNDIKGVIFTLYEIITQDMHFREVPYYEQDTAAVQELEEWKQHPYVKLDHPVSKFRSVLNEWVDKRREGRQVAIHTEAPECIDWPDLPAPPPSDLVFSDGKGNPTIVKSVVLSSSRRDEREKGVTFLNWERPAQIKLGGDKRVLANGQFAPGTEHTDSVRPNK